MTEDKLEAELAKMVIPDDCTCWGTNAVGHTDSDCPHNEWNR